MNLISSVDTFEKLIYCALIAMLATMLIAAIVDLAFFLFMSLASASPYVLEAHELIAILGAFLLILIGVELLDTIKLYFRENVIHVEIVLILAIIAVSRKVILLDPSGMNGINYGLELIGIGVIVAGLAGSYYLVKKAGIPLGPGGFSTEKKV